nr:hypothetical protein [Angustibacter aerolatus]
MTTPSAYLDHAATTPMVPEAVAAMADEPGPGGQPVLAAHRRPPRPPRRRGVARAAWPPPCGPGPARWCSPAGAPSPTTWP